MTKKHDIVFNLTIDDLKELGIIKKRRRRQRRIKYINGIPSNIKSSSDHMSGYSNLFTNTENLKTENLRLQNDMLIKYPMIKNDYEDRFKTIEDENNNNKVLSQYMLSRMYRPAIKNDNYIDDDSLSDFTRFETLPDEYGSIDDNIDVGLTYGSDSFKVQGQNPMNEGEEEEKEELRQEETKSNNTPNNVITVMRKQSSFNLLSPPKIIPDVNSTTVQDTNNEINVSSPLPVSEPVAVASPLTEQNMKAHNQEQSRYQTHMAKVNTLKQEYINAGGDDQTILRSRRIGEIKAATILLQGNSTKKKKKGKK
jgi:hypothetical protein